MKGVTETRGYRLRVVFDRADRAFGYSSEEVQPPDAHRRRPAHKPAAAPRRTEGVAVSTAPAVEPEPRKAISQFTLVSRRL